MTTVVRRTPGADLRGLIWFYVLATAVTWACYVPVVLARRTATLGTRSRHRRGCSA